jgi:hypothetical protein
VFMIQSFLLRADQFGHYKGDYHDPPIFGANFNWDPEPTEARKRPEVSSHGEKRRPKQMKRKITL